MVQPLAAADDVAPAREAVDRLLRRGEDEALATAERDVVPVGDRTPTARLPTPPAPIRPTAVREVEAPGEVGTERNDQPDQVALVGRSE